MARKHTIFENTRIAEPNGADVMPNGDGLSRKILMASEKVRLQLEGALHPALELQNGSFVLVATNDEPTFPKLSPNGNAVYMDQLAENAALKNTMHKSERAPSAKVGDTPPARPSDGAWDEVWADTLSGGGLN